MKVCKRIALTATLIGLSMLSAPVTINAAAADSQIFITSAKTFTQLDRTKPVVIDGNWQNWPTGHFCASWGNRVGVKVFGAPADYKGYNYNAGWLTYDKVDLYLDDNLKTYWSGPQAGAEGKDFDFAVKLDPSYKGQTFHVSIDTKGWAPGNYPVTISGVTYDSGDCGTTQNASMVIVIPPLVTPVIECAFSKNLTIRTGDSVSAECASTVPLNNLQLVLQSNKFGKWIDSANQVLATSNKFTIPELPTDTPGGISVRLSSEGVQDQLTPFVSQVLSYKVLPALEKIDFNLSLSKFSSLGDSQLKLAWPNSFDLAGEKFKVVVSSFPVGPWSEIKSGTFSASVVDIAVSEPKGTWLKVTYAGNSQNAPAESNILQIVETPIIRCSLPTSGKVDVKLTGTCTSNIKMLKTSFIFEVDLGSGWQENGPGSISGMKTSITLTPGSSGTIKLRIKSEGLIDSYGPFTSNVVTVKVPEPASSSSGGNGGSIPIPKGKVDKTSNAYKTMKTVGGNFAKVSLPSDTAMSQCASAMRTGFIKADGRPYYLGAQARMLQSYLRTPSGFQGCLDGFGH